MRILLLSDSHGNYHLLQAAIEKEQEKGFDVLVFLGDGDRDYDIATRRLSGISTYRVRGNNDWDTAIALSAAVQIGSHKYLLCHGHTYGVRSGTEALENAAGQNGCHAVLFGHTHCRHYSCSSGIHIFNPGSIALPRDGCGKSYGIITEENGKLDFFWENL